MCLDNVIREQMGPLYILPPYYIPIVKPLVNRLTSSVSSLIGLADSAQLVKHRSRTPIKCAIVVLTTYTGTLINNRRISGAVKVKYSDRQPHIRQLGRWANQIASPNPHTASLVHVLTVVALTFLLLM